MSTQWRSSLDAFLASHSGVVSVDVLASMGCNRREAYRLIDHGLFDVIMPGVFRSTHWPMGRDQLMYAACLRNELAIIAFTTAARQWWFRKLPPDDTVHVLVPHSSSPDLPGVTVHRCRRVDKVDVVARADGIRLTSPTRTLFDCADILGDQVTASNLELLINDGRGTFDTHLATLTRLAHPRRPGTGTMTTVINSRPAWRRAVQSELERQVLEEIKRQGLPMPELQLRIKLPSGRYVRIDFAWSELKVALEVDHPFWHDGYAEARRDKDRDLELATLGWQTIRITDLVGTALRDRIALLAQVLSIR